MSSGPVAFAASRLRLSLRNRSCCAPSIDLLLARRQSLIRKTSNSARAGSMSDAHLPNCPPMTAIVVTKKNLPSFSEKRGAPLPSPLTVHDEALRQESSPVPSSTAVESALRSALGIGNSDPGGTSPTASAAVVELDANVSTQDPAILDWSLCDPDAEDRVAEPMPKKTDSTRIRRLHHSGENEGESASKTDRAESYQTDRSTLLNAPLSALRNTNEAETDSALEQSSTSAATQVGDDYDAGANSALTPTKQRRRRRRRKRQKTAKIKAASVCLSDGNCSSDENCAVIGDERDGEGVVAAGWISELPAGLISSADTEDDDDDPVYSLKPLFTGKHRSSSSSKKSKPSKDKRPNYFVAIQVDDVNVHKAAKKVQDHMRTQEPNIAGVLVGIPTLHITLLVLRVNDGDDSLQRAKDSLSRSHQAVKDGLEAAPLILQFQGLDHFQKEVLYVKAIGEDSVSRLKAIAQVCREEFEKANLDLSGNKAFAPHLTLAKLSKQSRRKSGIKKIQEEWYAAFKDETFGTQKVNSLQLLSMSKPKEAKGYYYCSLEHTFGNFSRDQESGDHSECCAPAPSKASQCKIDQKLLQIDAAKQEVKRTISTLTNAKLQQLSELKQEPAEAELEVSDGNLTVVPEDEIST
ncbi:uncharacterized protein LOC119163545 [Rhipicephalus microplus]|uniref:uncharacterized protein LOC119163545 n=1 Tax=Rhipicephalus microplus TaxID=6941 RepID=UPI003F6D358D